MSFIICSLHQNIIRDGGGCSTHERDEKRIQPFSRKANIKMFNEICWDWIILAQDRNQSPDVVKKMRVEIILGNFDLLLY